VTTRTASLAAHPAANLFVGWRACFGWGLATVFYFYDYLLQVSPSAMKPELSMAFSAEAEQFGSLAAYYLYAYGLMQIPVGLLIDRFGPRRLLTLAAAFCALGSLLFGAADGLWMAKMGRIFMGVGASFAVVSCSCIAAAWFPVQRFALLTGVMVTVGMLGAVSGLAFMTEVVSDFGWRGTMQGGALIGAIMTALLWIVVRDKKKSRTAYPDVAQLKTLNIWQGLKHVMQRPQNWIAALFASLMFVPTLAFGGLWGLPFLVEAHGLEPEVAGKVISLIFVGFACGGPVFGWLSDYWGRRNLPMMVGALAALLICLIIIYSDHLPLPVMSSLLFALGFFSSAFILAFAVIRESNPVAISGTAIGFMNAINTFSGAIAQPIVGKILDLQAVGSEHVGQAIFSLEQYRTALVSLPASLLLSFILLWALKETYCKPVS